MIEKDDLGNMVRTVFNFGGDDMLVKINGKAYGETYKLDFDSTREGKEIILEMEVFSDTKIEELTKTKNATIKEIYAREDGKMVSREFHNVTYVGERSSNNINSEYISNDYIFSCRNYTEFKHE